MEGSVDVNIANIEAFVYVVHYGNINKAASVLFLSQPSVTARIQSLERELNCHLFDRAGKQMLLSEKGKQFLPYAQQLLDVYRKGRQQLRPQAVPSQTLTIGCTLSVANYVMAQILAEMKRSYNDLIFRLTTGTTDEIVGKLLNKEIDVGFVRNVSHPNILSSNYQIDPIRLYVYPGHPFIGHPEVTVAMVAAQPLVFFECGALDWIEIHQLFEKIDQRPNIQFMVDNSEAAKNLILSKAGIGFLPGVSVKKELLAHKLYEIPLPQLSSTALQTNLITVRGELPPLVAAFEQVARRIAS